MNVSSGMAFVHLLLIGLRHRKMMKGQTRLYDVDVVQQYRSNYTGVLVASRSTFNLILLVDCKY